MDKDRPQLSIEHAKQLAKELSDPGVIILSFHADHSLSIVSYGANKRKCDAMGKVLDGIHSLLMDGEIAIPVDFYD